VSIFLPSIRHGRYAHERVRRPAVRHASIQSIRERGGGQARDRPFPRQSTGPMSSGFARQPIANAALRLCDCTHERNDHENVTSYCRSSWRSASLATPETVPVNSPVAAKKTGLPRASANTGTTVSVNLSSPDASLKRPVPPVI
jgi:hypothetical protein